MIYFGLFKDVGWLSSDAAKQIMGAVVSGLRTLAFNIIEIVYALLVNVYNLFETLCKARLLNNDILKVMSHRIGLILGIIMFFYIVFQFIQMLIDPDKMADKEKGALTIVKKVLLVIVMLAVSNPFFNLLYGLQKKVIEESIIPKVVLPYSISTETQAHFGNILSANILKSFYYIDENILALQHDTTYGGTIIACESLINSFFKDISYNNKYDYGYMCLNESIGAQKKADNQSYDDRIYIVSFNGLLAIGVGIFAVYTIAIYCFKVGIRMIQLAFLEIISPMAIISYMSPKKDNMFTKWWGVYFSTYIDVFIRIAIINFAVFLIAVIFTFSDNYGVDFFETVGYAEMNFAEKSFIILVLVLAILTFAKKAPELLKQILPEGASKLGFGLGVKDVVGLERIGKTATGLLGGAAAGAVMGFIGRKGFGQVSGAIGGLVSGALSGFKGEGFGKTTANAWKNQKATNRRINEWKAAGGTNPFGRMYTGFLQSVGLDSATAAAKYDQEKTNLEQENAAYKAFDGYLDAAEKRAASQIEKGKFSSNVHAQKALQQKHLMEIYKNQSANIDHESYAMYDDKGAFLGYDEDNYQADLEALADKARKAEELYITEMKAAQKDYISQVLNGTITDDQAALQNLQQAAGIVAANSGYSGFAGVTEQSLLSGDYDTFDTTNGKAKGAQANNNTTIARNQTEGKAARANAKYSGKGK